MSGVVGYRRELRGQGRRIATLAVASVTGGVVGSVLLLVLPGSVFAHVVPVLILIALVLVVFGPRLRTLRGEDTGRISPLLWLLVLATGIYGGYFGAAQGIILFALLSIFVADHAQRLNGAKNMLAMFVNGVASIVFLVAASIDWKVVAVIAGGSVIGGQLGATVGRRLAPPVLRAVIVAVGLFAVVRLLA